MAIRSEVWSPTTPLTPSLSPILVGHGAQIRAKTTPVPARDFSRDSLRIGDAARRVGGGRGEPPCRHASGGRLKSTPCNRPLRPDQVQPHVNNRLFRPGCVPFFFLSACPGGVSVHGKQCLSPYGFQDAGVDGRRRRHPALGVPATLLRGLPPPPGPWPPERRPKAGSKRGFEALAQLSVGASRTRPVVPKVF